jgi:hypothetical protein
MYILIAFLFVTGVSLISTYDQFEPCVQSMTNQYSYSGKASPMKSCVDELFSYDS